MVSTHCRAGKNCENKEKNVLWLGLQEIITDKSQEGSQFVRGFGGIGGMLRYKVDFQSLQLDDPDEEEFDLVPTAVNPCFAGDDAAVK